MCAFILASRVRESKTERDIQKWATVANPTFDKTGYSETRPYEQRQADLNYI